MLKAKLDSIRKNKKGFSLIELIIVVAIMVALIAVLAPSYVKYVEKSRKASLQTAAEDIATCVKTELNDPDFTKTVKDTTITVSVVNGAFKVEFSDGGMTQADFETIKFEDGKKMGQTDYKYTIAITASTKAVVGPTEVAPTTGK